MYTNPIHSIPIYSHLPHAPTYKKSPNPTKTPHFILLPLTPSTSRIPLSAALETTKEVNIRKLLHLIRIEGFDDFLVVEEDPRVMCFVGEWLADESDVMPIFERGIWVSKEILALFEGDRLV